MPKTNVIETARLLLRHLTTADAPFIVRLMNEPAYHENIGDRGVRTTADGERYIVEKYLASYSSHGYGMYLVELRDTGEPIGICGLVKREVLDGPDVGFAIQQSHWAQGFGFESAAAAFSYARTVLSAAKVYGVVSPANDKSIRILKRTGMHYLRPIQLSAVSQSISLYGTELE